MLVASGSLEVWASLTLRESLVGDATYLRRDPGAPNLRSRSQCEGIRESRLQISTDVMLICEETATCRGLGLLGVRHKIVT